jgi:hypothetical protein
MNGWHGKIERHKTPPYGEKLCLANIRKHYKKMQAACHIVTCYKTNIQKKQIDKINILNKISNEAIVHKYERYAKIGLFL